MTEELYQEILQEVTWQNYQPFKYPSIQDNARVGIGFLLRNIWSVSSQNLMDWQTNLLLIVI